MLCTEVVSPRHSYRLEVTPKHRPSRTYGQFITALEGFVCDTPERNIPTVLANPQCRWLIRNDGLQTFAVHSTTAASAQRLANEGLLVHGARDIGMGFDKTNNPSRPNFGRTVVLLAGPEDKDQVRINTCAMAYEYKAGTGNSCKVVFAFPVPQDKTKNYVGSDIDKTFLGNVDGEIVQFAQDNTNEVNDSFYIDPKYMLGYFDLKQERFIYNPRHYTLTSTE